MEEWHALANAIVMQAVKDWRTSVQVLKKRPRHEKAKAMKADCERFFKSDWFENLTSVDGNVILHRLKQEEDTDDE